MGSRNRLRLNCHFEQCWRRSRQQVLAKQIAKEDKGVKMGSQIMTTGHPMWDRFAESITTLLEVLDDDIGGGMSGGKDG
jgi:hypothetical protein